MARVLLPPTVSDPGVEGLRVTETPGPYRLPKARASGQIDAAWVAGLPEALALLAQIVRPDGRFQLTQPQYEDLRFPAVGINPPGAATDPARDNSDGRFVFSATLTNTIAVQVQMPHGWKEGTPVEMHIHWSPTSADTGNVLWRVQYKIADIGGTFPSVWSVTDVLSAGSGTADAHQYADFGEIPMTGFHLSCMILVLISRVGNDTRDTYADTAKLNEFDIHYQANTLGSFEEVVKSRLRRSLSERVVTHAATSRRRLVIEWISASEDV